MILLLFSKIHL